MAGVLAKLSKKFNEVYNQVAVIKKEQGGRLRYYYGEKDTLPNVLLRSINDSGTATTCVSRLSSFIQGEGFIEESARIFMANESQTANQLLSDLAPSSATFEAFALLLKFSLDGETVRAYKVNIKELRRKQNETFRYNKRMGESDYLEKDDIILHEYKINCTAQDRAEMLRKQMAEHGTQLGFIYYPFKVKDFDFGDIYPIPDCNSGLEDIESDASLQRLERRNIKKGFKPNVIITMSGKTDDQTEDDSGKTEADYLAETLTDFTKDEGSSICLIEGQIGEAAPSVTPFDLAQMLDGVDKARTRVANAVCRHFSVPPVLIGLEVANILGNTQAIVNSLKMFNYIVKSRQLMITETFKSLWPNIEFEIKPLNIYDYLPTEVLAKLTDDELRKIGGYATTENQTPESAIKLINSLNSLNDNIASKVLEKMSDEQILNLVGLTKQLPNATTN